MATACMSLVELFHKLGVSDDVDFRRESVKVLAQAVMELKVTMKAGAERYGRTAGRSTSRNGARPSRRKTRVGKIELQIPKLRKGSYYPSFLGKDQRRQTERAPLALIQEAHVQGVSTRKVDANRSRTASGDGTAIANSGPGILLQLGTEGILIPSARRPLLLLTGRSSRLLRNRELVQGAVNLIVGRAGGHGWRHALRRQRAQVRLFDLKLHVARCLDDQAQDDACEDAQACLAGDRLVGQMHIKTVRRDFALAKHTVRPGRPQEGVA